MQSDYETKQAAAEAITKELSQWIRAWDGEHKKTTAAKEENIGGANSNSMTDGQPESTHLLYKGKYHCTADLLFDWLGLSCIDWV